MAAKKRSDKLALPRRAHDSTDTRARDCDGDGEGEGDCDGDHQRGNTEETQAIQRRGQETAREGDREEDGASTGDVERANALTSGAAAESECTLVANRSSRAGGARDVNNLHAPVVQSSAR